MTHDSRRLSPVVVVAALGFALSVLGFNAVRSLEEVRSAAEFEREAMAQIAALERSIDADLEVVRGLAAFFASGVAIDRTQFTRFTAGALGQRPSIQALEWVPRVPASARAEFERSARAEGLPEFRISERTEDNRLVAAGEREEYFPVHYLVPLEGNERALGFDLGSDSIRLESLRDARDSGRMTASGRITLVQEAAQESGLIVFAPIYEKEQSLSTVGQRRTHLSGFALGVVRIGDMVRDALAGAAATPGHAIDLYLYDADAMPDEALLHIVSGRPREAPAPVLIEAAARESTHLAHTIDVAGRPWAVVARPSAAWVGAEIAWQPRVTLVGGFLFTALLVAYLLVGLNRTRAIERMVEVRTRELREANDKLTSQIADGQSTAAALNEKEEMYRSLVEGSIQGILVHRDWKPLFVNRAYARMLGYESPEEILAQESIADQHAPHERERMWHFQQARRAGELVPEQYEYEAVRKDGTIITLLNSARSVTWQGEPAVQRTVVDVTERQRAQEQFRLAVEAAPNAMVMVDESGEIVLVNAQTETLFGYEREALIGEPVEILVPERLRAHHPGARRDFFASPHARAMGTGGELYGVRRDGSEFPIEIGLNPIQSDHGMLVLSAIVDITERKKIDQMKNEFVSTVSHELRTPLTSIMGSLGLIQAGAMGEISEQARAMVDIAYKNSDRLVRLINDILDVEKIESGKLVFRVESLEIDQVIAEAIEANAGFAVQHAVTLRAVDSLPGHRVEGDRDRLNQVLTNLLSNAIKFSPQGAEVEVRLRRAGAGVRVEVSDRGPGIPEEFQPEIFEKFAQADGSDTRRIGGTGLGLSIAKAIVERLGGSIGFETEIGKGTTFHFELPHVRAPGASAAAQTAVGSGPRILVCEDDIDVGTLLAIILGREGYVVDVANSAGEAKKCLAENRYAAMTLDLRLPDQSGLALIKELRERPETRGVPVIVVSAVATENGDELAGDAVGVVDCLDKPIDQKRLLEGIRRVTQTSKDGPRILHVEDEEDVRQVVAALVGPLAKVVPARSLRDARALLEAERFDLVLLDLTLPDGSGESLLAHLEESNHGATPVMIFSAQEVTAEMADSVSANLVKSRTSNDSLVEKIRALIGNRASEGSTVGHAA